MRVFLGWAGDEAKAVAIALKEWLPLVCPGLQPWISEDITKGARWSAEIAKTLRQSKAGVFVLTPDNLSSVWLHYEAGAISNVEGALVCTFLRRVDKAAVTAPLDVFQHTTAGDENDTRHLVTDLAALLPDAERTWDETQRRAAFDNWGWADLERKLAAIEPPKGGAAPPKPKTEEILAEILSAVRGLDIRERERTASQQRLQERVAKLKHEREALARGLSVLVDRPTLEELMAKLAAPMAEAERVAATLKAPTEEAMRAAERAAAPIAEAERALAEVAAPATEAMRAAEKVIAPLAEAAKAQ